MTGIRRIATVFGLTLAVLVGATIPASATFADTAAVPEAAVGTLTVQPPASVSTGGTKCVSRSVWNGWTWVTVWELQAKVSWPASATAATPRGIAGYRVHAVIGTTSYPIAEVDAATRSLGDTFPIEYASANIRVTVSTLTPYGWTSVESQPSPVIRC
jgi:hypothetical protein